MIDKVVAFKKVKRTRYVKNAGVNWARRRKEAVLVKKVDILGHDLTLLEEEQFHLPVNDQLHNIKKYTCLDNIDKRVVSFFPDFFLS